MVDDEIDLRDAISDINDAKRQDEDPNRLTLKQVKAKLKDPHYLQDVAEELLENTIELLA